MSPKRAILRALLAAAVGALLLAGTASAETKGKASGDIETVTKAVEAAFAELKIDLVESGVTFVFAMVVGKAETGSRITVSVGGAADGECELTVTSDGPEDPELEKTIVENVKSRT